MKIAHLVTVFPPYKSGIGNLCYQEVFELAKLGHEVTVFTPDYGQNKLPVTSNQLQVNYLKPLIKYGNAALMPSIIKELNNFDVIHLHYPFIGGAEVLLFSKLLQKFLRKSVPPGRDPRKSAFIVQYHMDLGMPKALSFLIKPYNFLVTKNIFKKADKILVSSNDYARTSRAIGNYFEKNKGKFIELPYGVDIDRFKPQAKRNDLLKKLNLTEKDKVILFVGGLDKAHYFKGIGVLLEALLRISTNFERIKLLIVGKGNQKEKYEKVVEKLRIKDKVIFAEHVDNQELPDYYNLADMFILSSINRLESFGIVLLEAMACGKPCIASNLPGVRTIVDDTKTGFLVEPNNLDDLAAKIKDLLENEILAKEMGRAGRAKVERLYDIELVVKKIEDLYKTLVPNNR